jgi:hypothetical protein
MGPLFYTAAWSVYKLILLLSQREEQWHWVQLSATFSHIRARPPGCSWAGIHALNGKTPGKISFWKVSFSHEIHEQIDFPPVANRRTQFLYIYRFLFSFCTRFFKSNSGSPFWDNYSIIFLGRKIPQIRGLKTNFGIYILSVCQIYHYITTALSAEFPWRQGISLETKECSGNLRRKGDMSHPDRMSTVKTDGQRQGNDPMATFDEDDMLLFFSRSLNFLCPEPKLLRICFLHLVFFVLCTTVIDSPYIYK